MMWQTPTPPPLKVDVTAITAVAVNVSAIILSPGGTPVAAIAVAGTTATNASAITTSPGGMPVAAIGLNVAGMNPNVMFAPLRVGSTQQNSGNSARLQSTTQSNSGFSAGLVGGFGATHSGSTSTTTSTLGSNYVPKKKGNASMLSPFSGSIDPLSLTGIAKYINSVKSLYNERIDCSVGNCNLVFAGLAEKAKQYSMAILRIPTSGTGKMAVAPLTIIRLLLVNFELVSFLFILF
jgi:hypothetical protein